ncbi:MAG TPA: hypothetical protein VFW11_01750 [Cyclobacteriaceae bacterium]|nr:hypothetical protein [Cyclobacteriaceae bacterium]
MSRLRTLSILSMFVLGASVCFSQTKGTMQGKVTFITSNNVYVKFDNTKNITIGDTLYIARNSKWNPCLVVKNKSSMSCVAVLVNGCSVNTGDQIVHKSSPDAAMESPDKKAVIEPENRQQTANQKGKIRGSISAAGYSSISSLRDDSYRTMYRLSLSAAHLNNSKFSFETYINYRQTFISNDSTTIRGKDAFNIYNLAVRFDADPTTSIVLGRKINPKFSSVGAIDGLQVEKFFGNFCAGLVGGFRPDVMDYTFNPDLLQYGGYIGLQSHNKTFYGQTTLGVLEQRNNSEIDRRYLYFQHSSTIGEKVNLFSSFELDLYNEFNGGSVRDPGLTNFFISAGYRISRNIDLNLSYDSRKKILYYETLKTEIERMLDDDIARQGVRLQLNVRPYKYVSAGLSFSKRFQSNDMNKSDNVNGYVSLSRLPLTGGRLFINYNWNTSLYMESNIFSFRYSNSFIKMKLDASVYYRMASYTYLDKEVKNDQQYYGIDLSYRIARKILFGILGEMATLATEDNYRINARIMKSF